MSVNRLTSDGSVDKGSKLDSASKPTSLRSLKGSNNN